MVRPEWGDNLAAKGCYMLPAGSVSRRRAVDGAGDVVLARGSLQDTLLVELDFPDRAGTSRDIGYILRIG